MCLRLSWHHGFVMFVIALTAASIAIGEEVVARSATTSEATVCVDAILSTVISIETALTYICVKIRMLNDSR